MSDVLIQKEIKELLNSIFNNNENGDNIIININGVENKIEKIKDFMDNLKRIINELKNLKINYYIIKCNKCKKLFKMKNFTIDGVSCNYCGYINEYGSINIQDSIELIIDEINNLRNEMDKNFELFFFLKPIK